MQFWVFLSFLSSPMFISTLMHNIHGQDYSTSPPHPFPLARTGVPPPPAKTMTGVPPHDPSPQPRPGQGYPIPTLPSSQDRLCCGQYSFCGFPQEGVLVIRFSEKTMTQGDAEFNETRQECYTLSISHHEPLQLTQTQWGSVLLQVSMLTLSVITVHFCDFW